MVDIPALEFLDTAALQIFDPVCTARPRFFIVFVANFLPALAEAFQLFLRRFPNAVTLNVSSPTAIDF